MAEYKARFWLDETEQWGQYFLLDMGTELPKLNERFDEALSECHFSCYSNDLPTYVLPIKVWTKCEVVFNKKVFVGFVSTYDEEIVQFGRLNKGIKRVRVGVLELLSVTQYMPTDNLCFTNTIDSTIDPDTGKVTTKIYTRTAFEYIERINTTLYSFPVQGDYSVADRPFVLVCGDGDWWTGVEMPEMTFTEMTLFEILKNIGDVVGGFPYLELIKEGRVLYKLHYRQWDNPNLINHEVTTDIIDVENHGTIENQGDMIVSSVKNMLSVSASGDNACVYPCEEDRVFNYTDEWGIVRQRKAVAVKSVSAESYVTDVTNLNAFIELPTNIYKILKLEMYSPYLTQYYGVAPSTTTPAPPDWAYAIDITAFVVEYDKWVTLQEGTEIESWLGIINERKFTRLYYSYNGNKIENLKNAGYALVHYYKHMIDTKDDVGRLHENDAPQWSFRVTYIPITDGRVMARRTDGKPIGQIINQDNNIISANAYANNLQGLVNRMHGQYTQIYRRVPNTQEPFNIGQYINGQVITEAQHQYAPKEIHSVYTTSPQFNRRSQYIGLRQNLRQWEIPATDKVTDRNILYAEELQVSVGTLLEESNGALTKKGLYDFVANFAGGGKPTLAYIGYKKFSKIVGETHEQNDNSINYALSTVTSIPFGRSVLMTWRSADNASMGARTLKKAFNLPDVNFLPGASDRLQYYIPYNEKAENLCFEISEKAPTTFDFNNSYTETEKEGEYNATFKYTFPMSNRQQYVGCYGVNSIASFHDIKIMKDLSERIIFNFQLQYVGKNDTIVYDKMCSACQLCNSKELGGLKIYTNNLRPYGLQDKKGIDGNIYDVARAYKTYSNGVVKMTFEFDSTEPYKYIGLTDMDGNLLLASNKPGVGGKLEVYLSNRRIKWKRI